MFAAFVDSSFLLNLKEKAIFTLVYLTHKEKYSFRNFIISYFPVYVNALMEAVVRFLQAFA